MASPLLEMRGIDKRYTGVDALKQVNLTLEAGEVLALMGENGAGKSTLMKILGGAHRPDDGEIRIAGQAVTISSPQQARSLGIAMIYQEFNLVPGLSAAENVFLGQEILKHGVIQHVAQRERTNELLKELGMDFDPDTPCQRLTIAQQQSVEIARALCLEARILVLDEPSAVLTTREVERLFAIIDQCRKRGLGMIYIGHRLDEIFQVADRMMVLRDGAHAGSFAIDQCTREGLIECMVGRPLDQEFPKREPRPGAVRLKATGLSRGTAVQGVSLEARGGEILALAGLVGAGRTELARLLFGADRRDAGTIELDGQPLSLNSPAEAIASGIGLLTEDRKLQGLMLQHSSRDNFGLPNLDQYLHKGMLSGQAEQASFETYIQAMRVKLTGPQQPAGHLSGGNQQKLVMAKWLARQCEVLIFDEPTRGIDVGAKYEIYQLMHALADEGKVILMISSELPEVLGMADRILVMHEGRLTGEITRPAESSQQAIMELAVA